MGDQTQTRDLVGREGSRGLPKCFCVFLEQGRAELGVQGGRS